MSRSLNMNLYLTAFSIAIRFVLFVPIQRFFWPANCKILVFKLCLLFQTILDLWPVLMLEIFGYWDIKKGQCQLLVTFLVVFFWAVMYKSGLYIIIYFEHGKCFIWGFLVFTILVFSVFKYLKFLAIFPVLKTLKFWSVNYICQVCKLYFYFERVQNFGQYLYLTVFNKQWKCPTFSFS